MNNQKAVLGALVGAILAVLLLRQCVEWAITSSGTCVNCPAIPVPPTATQTPVPSVPPTPTPVPTASSLELTATSGERGVLVALYEATGGEQWIRKDGWLSDRSICTWYGVTCTDNHVVKLQLKGNNLKGRLPPEIGQLASLRILDLNSAYGYRGAMGTVNEISYLPPEIGQLTSLETLDLCNGLISQLPPEIGHLSSLRDLFLDNNKIAALPPEIGQLTNLETLRLSNNQLSHLPPEIGQMTNLQMLYLYNNQLVDLPLEISQLANLQMLYLGKNPFTELTGLPLKICQLPDLQMEPSGPFCDPPGERKALDLSTKSC